MVKIVKREFKDLVKAFKTLNYFEESLFYMDFLWGLHPHFKGVIPSIKFCFFLSVAVTYVSLVIYMIVDEYAGIETLKKTDIVSPTWQVAFLLFSYKLNTKIVQDLIEKIERFWPINDELIEEIEYKLRLTRYFIFGYKSTIFVTTIYYNIIALTHPEVPFPTECYNFCDIQNMFCYCFIFFFVDLGVFVLVWGIYTFDGFFAGVLTRAIVQIKLIKFKLEKLNLVESAENSSDNIDQSLRDIIEHHGFVLDFVDDINRLYARVLFTQFSSLIFSMCIGSFLLTLHGVPTPNTLIQYVVYLACMFLQVFVYSFGGQVLLDETASIADSAYYTNWYEAKVSVQKAISAIMLRAQGDTKISVGGIADLDLRMYLYAAKTSFSFYTMMNQMYASDL